MSTTHDTPGQALARNRWAKTTKAQRRAEMDRVRASQSILDNTPAAAAARSERARKAAAASAKVRSAAAKKKKSAKRKSKSS